MPERQTPCNDCTRPCVDNPFNSDQDCWRSPFEWIEWLALKATMASNEQEHEGLDPYGNNLLRNK